ncbi:MAG: TlpA family protein disulfide reductase [Candidatus Nitrohelix vancouverensis]|uniref:TlpA family protein disulfide reductase n=1 Tax=Candidatus Nitrohelix vancouverensis TaxID=2705534 RepID=A0A7T0G261_9BACT|nr:MAG: TlpA family protein disulfide reductase [Candidatus Nitrohelix vancouverensis]
MKRAFTILTITASLLYSALAWAHSPIYEKMGVVPPRTEKAAPLFTLENMQGQTVQFDQYFGKPLLLHFWATWCVPCREELPALQKLYESIDRNNLEIVAINIDRGNRDRVEEYIAEMGLTFPMLLDPNQKVRRNYYINGLPTSYLIGPDGTFQGFISGARNWNLQDSNALFSLLKSRQ